MLSKLKYIVLIVFFIISYAPSQVNVNDSMMTNNNLNKQVNEKLTDSNFPTNEIILILFGSIIGFCFSVLSYFFIESRNRKLRKQKGEHLIKSILNEVEEGIKRCDYLAQLKDKGQISFSRIYVSLWQAMQADLSHYIYEFLKDANTLKHIHSIYYTFDLINFNMERNEFDVGAAFANDHRKKIEDEYTILKTNLIEKKIKI